MKKILLLLTLISLSVSFFAETKTFYITRHGQRGDPKYQKKFKYCDEDALMPKGEEQAKRLGQYLNQQGFHGTIYVSPYYRTLQTATFAASQLPDLPMILEPVEGKPIDRTSLMVPRSGLMSSFLMVKFLGRYSKNMMIEKVSDMMLIRIYPITAIRVPYFINFGKISRTTSSLNSCSRMFDTEWGIICCLPKKYPLMILDRDINGRTSERAING